MTIKYIDTRGFINKPYEFSEVIIKGIAPGGGLFVPELIPQLTLDEILSLANMTYAQAAAFIYKRFETDFSDKKIDELMEQAYSDNFDTPEIAPVKRVGEQYVLELWHGPTSAFKDMALQCLPLFFSAAIEKQRAAGVPGSNRDFLIAVATSGDTGKAALAGFANKKHTNIEVFYPYGGVSDIQFKQMATQTGNNVNVTGVRGNFDDCQTSVKEMFNDAAFNKTLSEEYNTVLSSANSINWGRLLPQIVYYVNSYAQMVNKDIVKAGNKIDVTVPTGNFGNILACWYAKEMGTPIRRIVCASNANCVLTDFIDTGTYSIENREFVLTTSPSMDILVSSNLERQLFEFANRDASCIKKWMSDLNSKSAFTVNDEVKEAFQTNYGYGSVSDNESFWSIFQTYNDLYYLMDPHTAVAYKMASIYRSVNPMLVVSTAHWAKFGKNVYRALLNMKPGEEFDDYINSLTDAQLNKIIAELTYTDGAPKALDELDDAPIRFNNVIDGAKEDIEKSTTDFLSSLQ